MQSQSSNTGIKAYFSRAIYWTFIERGVYLVAGVLTTVLAARILPLDEVGKYFVLLNLVTLGSMLNISSFDNYLMKFLPEALVARDFSKVSFLSRRAYLNSLLISALLSPIFLTDWGRGWLGTVLKFDINVALGAMLMIWALLFAWQRLNTAALKALYKARSASVHGGFLTSLATAAVFLVAFLIGYSPTLEQIILLIVLAYLLDVILGLVALGKNTSRLPSTSEANVVVQGMLSWSLPILVAQLILYVANLSGPLILSSLSVLSQVAIFGVAYRVAALVGVPNMIFSSMLVPMVSGLIADNNSAALEKVAQFTASASLLLSTIVFCFFLFVGEALVTSMFGLDYRASTTIIIILSIGILADSATGSNGIILNQAGHKREVLIVTSLSCAIALIPSLVYANKYGALAVALSFATASVCQQFSMTFLVGKLVGVKSYASPALILRLLAHPRSLFTEISSTLDQKQRSVT